MQKYEQPKRYVQLKVISNEKQSNINIKAQEKNCSDADAFAEAFAEVILCRSNNEFSCLETCSQVSKGSGWWKNEAY